jgi:hypothetical protein
MTWCNHAPKAVPIVLDGGEKVAPECQGRFLQPALVQLQFLAKAGQLPSSVVCTCARDQIEWHTALEGGRRRK